jgi:hypothetical protein
MPGSLILWRERAISDGPIFRAGVFPAMSILRAVVAMWKAFEMAAIGLAGSGH